MNIIEDVQNWSNEVNNGKFDYIVAFTSRDYNLLNHFLDKTNVMTCGNLLMEAANIADYYVKNKKLPTICIATCMIVFGDDLNDYLNGFKQTLHKILSKTCEGYNEVEFDKSYFRALIINSFASKNGAMFLDAEYQWRLKYKYLWQQSEWRKYFYQLSVYLKENLVNVYNTSASAESFVLKSDTWDVYKDIYVNKVLAMYGIYGAVHRSVINDRNYFTPYIFINKTDSNGLVTVLRRVLKPASNQDKDNNAKLISILNKIAANPGSLGVYYDIFCMILQTILLNLFLNDIDASDVRINTHKVLEFLNDIDIDSEQFAVAIGKQAERDSLEIDDADLYAAVEVYKHAAKYESYGHALERNIDKYKVKVSSASKSVQDFMCSTYKNNVCILFNLMNMQQKGLIALRPVVKKDASGNWEFSQSVVTNELTLSIFPVMVAKYSPSYYLNHFFRVSQFYWRDDVYVTKLKEYFESFYRDAEPTKEQLETTKYSVKLAEIISENKDVVGSLLNWRSIFEKD